MAQIGIFAEPYEGSTHLHALDQRVDVEKLAASLQRTDTWPSEELFEECYKYSLPPYKPPKKWEKIKRRPILRVAKTVDADEELLEVLRQSDELLQTSEQTLLPMEVTGPDGAHVLASPADVYTHFCASLGVVPMAEMPEFGEDFELRATVLGGKGRGTSTGHAYAFAAALSTVPVKRITMVSTFITDEGIAKIISTAARCERLEAIHLENHACGHKTINAIYGLAQSWQLRSIRLPSCGLGGTVDVAELVDFPSYRQCAEKWGDLDQHRINVDTSVSMAHKVAQEALGRGEKASVFVQGEKPAKRMQSMPLLFPVLRL